MRREIRYTARQHAAVRTTDYVFNQLIPYIGNKRKLLDLIQQALQKAGSRSGATFLDLFAGSGVVARFAKRLGYSVICNDWEPYSRVINNCYIAQNEAPAFDALGGYERALEKLNSLAPREDWITRHLCPRDDEKFDTSVDRMFYMRKNGMRIDAIRHQIAEWKDGGIINDAEEACLIAPLLYQGCYTSNTSGVFKGFHNGWGGQTKTALYRIAGELSLAPAVFFDNKRENRVLCDDAQRVAELLQKSPIDVAYLDPPYNQHPYGSNYHVLNSIALWDKPEVSPSITKGEKSAIRTDWRTARRSAYNHRMEASQAYARLVQTLNAGHILTSYSTDGFIPLEEMLSANVGRGETDVVMRGYKRYRVSSQRFSEKPMNVEFVLVLNTNKKSTRSVDELLNMVLGAERKVLEAHPETKNTTLQMGLFSEEDTDHV